MHNISLQTGKLLISILNQITRDDCYLHSCILNIVKFNVHGHKTHFFFVGNLFFIPMEKLPQILMTIA